MGKNVLIIGASGDIGSAIAHKLALDKYQLILHYNKNKDRITRICSECHSDAILQVIQANLTEEVGINKLLDEIAFPVNKIIFASGKAFYGLFQDMSDDEMNDLLTLHVKAPLMITRNFLPAMIQQRQGNIVFITSIWGSVGASYEVMYSTVKGAQNSFIKSLAKEVGPSGIRVNAVSPGYIQTKMNQHLSFEEQAQIIGNIPMQRAGVPEDIAHSVSFLLNEKSSYIQGEIINVTGGWH